METISQLRAFLEGQHLIETKILLDKIKTKNDVTELISPQWLPLVTDVEHPAISRFLAFVKSPEPLGLGSVLLNQARFKFKYDSFKL